MTDHPLHEKGAKNGNAFPLMVSLTALVLAVTSGVVNYRQNNLANLESSLRDTRDQLQLAKNDITDIKVKTINQLVDAEFAIKNQQHMKQENLRLGEELTDAKARVSELEGQIKRMDHKLVNAMASLKKRKKKAGRKKSIQKKPAKTKPVAAHASLSDMIASTDLDVYTRKIPASVQQSIGKVMNKDGYKVKFPEPSASMSFSDTTTVFYYDADYKAVAKQLATSLATVIHEHVSIRKGASPYPKNKIIAHIIGTKSH